MKPYPRYRPSGVDWLGEVPEGWEVGPLKTSFLIVGGTTPKTDVEEFWDGNIPWITPADLSNLPDRFISSSGRQITEAGLNSCGTTLVDAGSIVLSTRAPIGSLAISKVETCINQGCKALVPRNGTSADFFYYVLLGAKDQLNVLGRGSTFLELSGDQLASFRIPLPPLAEQRGIAGFLDLEVGKIDALIAEQRQLIALLAEKRQATISTAVTRGLSPDTPLKPSGVEWLGDIPEGWEALSLRRCSLYVQTGATPSDALPEQDQEDGFTWYTPGDFGDALDLSVSSRTIAMAAAQKGIVRVFPAGSILIVSIGATLGKVGVAQKPCSANQQINAVVPNELVLSRFLGYSLAEKAAVMRFLSNASTIGIMNQEKTKEIVIAVPPLAEQDAITVFLDAATAQLNALTTTATEAIALLLERRAALISAAVTGKIDVQDLSS